MKLLLVEDDLNIVSVLEHALNREGFAVHCETQGGNVLNIIQSFEPELLVLDLGLPDMDGIDLLRKIRRRYAALSVLVLTARDSLTSKVDALDLGADDYLTKPFEMPELLARLRVLGRRLGTATSSEITIDDVTLNTSAHSLQVNDVQITLSRREYMVLKALMENKGRIQSREAIESKLYGWGEEIGSNTVEVHVSHLRKKLPNGFIKTIRGVGYTISSK